MYYFIVNEHGQGGKARKVWTAVQEMLAQKGVEYKAFVSEEAGHATRIASDICGLSDDDKRVVVVGGDGTINEVLNGINDFDHVSLGLIPTGSGNDFSRGMNVPRNTCKALEKILSSREDVCIDLGVAKAGDNPERIFGISSGIGLDAIVCKIVDGSKLKKVLNKLHMGNLSYIIKTISTLFSMKTYEISVSFNDGPEMAVNKGIFLAVMNMPTEGGGIPMNPMATPYDGELSVCMAHGIPKVKTFFLLPFLSMGHHTKFKGFHVQNAATIKVTSKTPMTVHADGEYLGDVNSLYVECKKKKLKVLV